MLARYRRGVLLLVAGCCLAQATVIVDVSGTPSVGTSLDGIVGFEQWLGVSWTQAVRYTNVSISATLGNLFILPNPLVTTGTAYLTTQVGAGTNAASHQLSSAAFVTPAVQGTTVVTLFSGLTLNPGTYFLTLIPTEGQGSGTGWISTASPVITLAPGASKGSDIFVNTDTGVLNFSYGPASTWVNDPSFDPNVGLFAITGTAPSAVPEPRTSLGAAAALLFLGGLKIAKKASEERRHESLESGLAVFKRKRGVYIDIGGGLPHNQQETTSGV